MLDVLRSFDSVWRFGRLDVITGEFVLYPFWWRLSRPNPAWTGWYKRTQSGLAALYVQNGHLHFWLDRRVIQLDEAVSASLTEEGNRRRLELRRDAEVLCMVYQRSTTWRGNEFDLTAFAEDEHSDFGLFVYHVATQSEKRAVMIETFSAAS